MGEKFFCKMCNLEFTNKKNLIKHYQCTSNHHEKLFHMLNLISSIDYYYQNSEKLLKGVNFILILIDLEILIDNYKDEIQYHSPFKYTSKYYLNSCIAERIFDLLKKTSENIKIKKVPNLIDKYELNVYFKIVKKARKIIYDTTIYEDYNYKKYGDEGYVESEKDEKFEEYVKLEKEKEIKQWEEKQLQISDNNAKICKQIKENERIEISKQINEIIKKKLEEEYEIPKKTKENTEKM